MNGFETALKIKSLATKFEPFILAVSANMDPITIKKCNNAKIDSYTISPLNVPWFKNNILNKLYSRPKKQISASLGLSKT